jgi:hypothetical protein
MARVWIKPPNGTYQYATLYVTGYSPGYNSMQFTLQIWKLPSSTTEAQCTQGATYKNIQGAESVSGQS